MLKEKFRMENLKKLRKQKNITQAKLSVDIVYEAKKHICNF